MKEFDHRLFSGSVCILARGASDRWRTFLSTPEAIADALCITLQAGQWLAPAKYRLAIRFIAQAVFNVAFFSLFWTIAGRAGHFSWQSAVLPSVAVVGSLLCVAMAIREFRNLSRRDAEVAETN